MSLADDEQSLYDVAQAALPREFFRSQDDPHEQFHASAAIMATAKAQVDDYKARTLTVTAFGIWLDQLARDKGTRRQAGESDVALQKRLRLGDATVTVASLVRNNTLDVRPVGVTGSVNYNYTVLYDSGSGNYQLVGSGSITDGHSLGSGHYNRIRWITLGVGTYRIYRTVGGASQGLIALVESDDIFEDKGSAGDGSTLPVYSDAPVEGIATKVLRADGVTIPAGYPSLVELRRDKGYSTLRLATITCVEAAKINDGDTVTIVDGATFYTTFEFDKNGSVLTGNIAVNISTAVTAADVATALYTATSGLVFSNITPIPTPTGAEPHKVYFRGNPSTNPAIIADSNTSDTVADTAFKVTNGGRTCYLSRGYRLGAPPPINKMIVILPYGTSASTAASISEAVRQRKGAGIAVIVERRTSP